MMQEELGLPLQIKVLVSKDLGMDELAVGLEDLKDTDILHHEFPKTLPEKRRDHAKQVNVQYNNIREDQCSEQMEVREKREERVRPRGVPLYLEERYEQVFEKISNFDSFPKKVKVVTDKYFNVFDTKLQKNMNVEPLPLNVREGTKPYACFLGRPTPAHYRETGMKLVQDLLNQHIMKRCSDSRREWCAPAHCDENLGRASPALWLDVDFTRLNDCPIPNQP